MEDKLTKAAIIESLHNKLGLNRADIHVVIDELFEEIKDGLKDNRVIELRGFGTFEVRIRKGRERARNPKTGDVLICDNDNVAPNGTNMGIVGKPRYMAPEIVRGDIDKSTGLQQMPDVHSDRFSLSVILFMTLCMGHPYEGETMKNYDIIDEIAELEMYGKNPIFVYHKLDKSNRPVRGYHHSLIRRWLNSTILNI